MNTYTSVDLRRFLACRIELDGEHWDCSGFRTRKENLQGAWMKLFVDYGGKYLPKTYEDFIRRGGKVKWFTSS